MKAISEVRVKRFVVEKDDNGSEKISGKYELIAPSGAVLASQDFNTGYGDVKLEASEKTRKLLLETVASFKEDINTAFFGGE